MSEEKPLSKFDRYFLALVGSGAIPLERVEPEHKSEDGVGIYYVPEQRVIARNLRQLQELEPYVRRMVEQIENGEDPEEFLDK